MKINLRTDQEVFLTSDTHFGHHNLCKGVSNWTNTRPGETRDFNTLEQMNDTIVNNINDMVNENDILIHLGDWSFGGVDKFTNSEKELIVKIFTLFW